MLQRNLLYTAVTRAQKIVVLVGAKKAIEQAVRVAGAGRRHTALSQRLRPLSVASQDALGHQQRVTDRGNRPGPTTTPGTRADHR
jgi:ATP-dependent exoDNAse (exonuclease V), alpha subunit - helicase superfamily I member